MRRATGGARQCVRRRGRGTTDWTRGAVRVLRPVLGVRERRTAPRVCGFGAVLCTGTFFTVTGNVGCLVSDRVILSGPSDPERTQDSSRA